MVDAVADPAPPSAASLAANAAMVYAGDLLDNNSDRASIRNAALRRMYEIGQWGTANAIDLHQKLSRTAAAKALKVAGTDNSNSEADMQAEDIAKLLQMVPMGSNISITTNNPSPTANAQAPAKTLAPEAPLPVVATTPAPVAAPIAATPDTSTAKSTGWSWLHTAALAGSILVGTPLAGGALGVVNNWMNPPRQNQLPPAKPPIRYNGQIKLELPLNAEKTTTSTDSTTNESGTGTNR